MADSPLVTVEIPSPNNSGKRLYPLTRITPHCFVGQVTAQRGLEVFVPKSKEASANYVVGYDGQIGQGVPEDTRSWCSSSKDNDNRAITIEVASDTKDPYAITKEAEEALLSLMTDICRRHNKTALVWIPDKAKALAYKPKDNELLITVHRWFAAKSCPGDYIYNRLAIYAAEVTKRLGKVPETSGKYYKVQVGAFKVKANATAMLEKLKAAGFDGYIKEE